MKAIRVSATSHPGVSGAARFGTFRLPREPHQPVRLFICNQGPGTRSNCLGLVVLLSINRLSCLLRLIILELLYRHSIIIHGSLIDLIQLLEAIGCFWISCIG